MNKTDEGQTLSLPTGKVVGVVDTQTQFDDVVPAPQKAGFDKIQSLHGEEGVHLLERVHDFFWGDSKEAVLQQHIRELKDGLFVIVIATPSDRAKEAADVAARHGARFLVHFGSWSVTWLK